jgi:hypothetical protein
MVQGLELLDFQESWSPSILGVLRFWGSGIVGVLGFLEFRIGQVPDCSCSGLVEFQIG